MQQNIISQRQNICYVNFLLSLSNIEIICCKNHCITWSLDFSYIQFTYLFFVFRSIYFHSSTLIRLTAYLFGSVLLLCSLDKLTCAFVLIQRAEQRESLSLAQNAAHEEFLHFTSHAKKKLRDKPSRKIHKYWTKQAERIQ